MKTSPRLGILLVGLLIISGCTQKPNTHAEPPTVEAPENIISLQTAKTLFTNYGENRVGLIEEFENQELPEGTDPYRATRSITFDFDMLKKYMEYIEQEAHTTDTEIKGLRVYLGQYPNTETTKHPSAETVFFNPTMILPSGQEVSFAIQNVNNTATAIPVGTVTANQKPSGKANLIMTLQGDITSLALNQGHRRPPPVNDDNDY